jgi:nicotinate-nucleotide adenylyltransferase
MPAAAPPHKVMPENSFGAAERLELAELTFGGFNNVEISDFEINNRESSYTIDTIKALDIDDLTLVLGTDMFLDFEKWHEFEEILQRVRLAVIRRDGQAVTEHINCLKVRYDANVTVIDADIVEISSTQLRHNGAAGAAYRAIRSEILRIIHPKRLAHSLGTECEAVKLAERYGSNTEEAAAAALLHDCTKHWTTERHLQYCEECYIMTDKTFSGESKLMHGVTAAELARREFGVNDNVYDAIRYHTTGRVGMSKQELIIYLADKLEPTREYKDVPEYRRMAYESLERATLAIMDMNIRKLTETKKIIHPIGIEARNYLLEGLTL